MAAVQSHPYCKWHTALLVYQKNQQAENRNGYFATSTDGWKTTTLRHLAQAPDPGPPPGPPPAGGCSSGSLIDSLMPVLIFGGGVASFAAPLIAGASGTTAGAAGTAVADASSTSLLSSAGTALGEAAGSIKGAIAGAGGLESILGKLGRKVAEGGKLGFNDILSTLDTDGLPDWLQQGLGIYEQLSAPHGGGSGPAAPPQDYGGDAAANVAKYGKAVAIGIGVVVVVALALSIRKGR
jgi:hypothetical protein